MSVTKGMTINDNSLLQYFQISEKTKSVYHPKQVHQQRLSDQKYRPQPCTAKTSKMQLGHSPSQDPSSSWRRESLRTMLITKSTIVSPEPRVSK